MTKLRVACPMLGRSHPASPRRGDHCRVGAGHCRRSRGRQASELVGSVAAVLPGQWLDVRASHRIGTVSPDVYPHRVGGPNGPVWHDWG